MFIPTSISNDTVLVSHRFHLIPLLQVQRSTFCSPSLFANKFLLHRSSKFSQFQFLFFPITTVIYIISSHFSVPAHNVLTIALPHCEHLVEQCSWRKALQNNNNPDNTEWQRLKKNNTYTKRHIFPSCWVLLIFVQIVLKAKDYPMQLNMRTKTRREKL